MSYDDSNQPPLNEPVPGQQPVGGSSRPAWLAPASIGLGVGLLVALVAVVATRGGDDDDVAAPIDATTTTLEADTEPAVTEPAPETAPPATEAPVETEAPAAPATEAPVVTEAPVATEAPVVTDAPVAAEPNGLQAASPGMVRFAGQEYPIVRQCAFSKFAGFSVTSWLFFDDSGRPQIVEVAQDEGSEPFGMFNGETDELTDFGDDGFGFLWFESDGPGVPLSVNVTDDVSFDCLGTAALTDPEFPDMVDIDQVVDVCFGEHIDFYGEPAFGYSGLTQDGGMFSASPDAGSSYSVRYSSPYFGADLANIEALGGPSSTAFEGVFVGNPNGSYAGESRLISVEFSTDMVRDCGAAD